MQKEDSMSQAQALFKQAEQYKQHVVEIIKKHNDKIALIFDEINQLKSQASIHVLEHLNNLSPNVKWAVDNHHNDYFNASALVDGRNYYFYYSGLSNDYALEAMTKYDEVNDWVLEKHYMIRHLSEADFVVQLKILDKIIKLKAFK